VLDRHIHEFQERPVTLKSRSMGRNSETQPKDAACGACSSHCPPCHDITSPIFRAHLSDKWISLSVALKCDDSVRVFSTQISIVHKYLSPLLNRSMTIWQIYFVTDMKLWIKAFYHNRHSFAWWNFEFELSIVACLVCGTQLPTIFPNIIDSAVKEEIE
jgi:hypothetical protein